MKLTKNRTGYFHRQSPERGAGKTSVTFSPLQHCLRAHLLPPRLHPPSYRQPEISNPSESSSCGSSTTPPNLTLPAADKNIGARCSTAGVLDLYSVHHFAHAHRSRHPSDPRVWIGSRFSQKTPATAFRFNQPLTNLITVAWEALTLAACGKTHGALKGASSPLAKKPESFERRTASSAWKRLRER